MRSDVCKHDVAGKCSACYAEDSRRPAPDPLQVADRLAEAVSASYYQRADLSDLRKLAAEYQAIRKGQNEGY